MICDFSEAVLHITRKGMYVKRKIRRVYVNNLAEVKVKQSHYRPGVAHRVPGS